MKHIKNELIIKGFTYKLLKRASNIALFEQSKNGDVYGYEVHKIRVSPKREIRGIILEKGERLASDEDFGRYGWSYQIKDNAMNKYDALILSQNQS